MKIAGLAAFVCFVFGSCTSSRISSIFDTGGASEQFLELPATNYCRHPREYVTMESLRIGKDGEFHWSIWLEQNNQTKEFVVTLTGKQSY